MNFGSRRPSNVHDIVQRGVSTEAPAPIPVGRRLRREGEPQAERCQDCLLPPRYMMTTPPLTVTNMAAGSFAELARWSSRAAQVCMPCRKRIP
jgi:hypothetical protein